MKSCWECKYQQKGGNTLLGFCLYFELIGQEKKEIPQDIVDKGCKKWVSKDSKNNPLVDYAMNLFDGELIK